MDSIPIRSPLHQADLLADSVRPSRREPSYWDLHDFGA